MNRLDFLRKGATTAASVLVTTIGLTGLLGAITGCEEKPAPSKVIGLQLYSLRDSMSTNAPATLQSIAEMGYKTLETASYSDGKLYNMSPEEFRAMVEKLGMTVTSAHVGHAWDPEKEQEIIAWWDQALDTHKAAGCRYVIQPSFPIGETIEDIKAYCDYFNRIGQMAKDKGMRFGFHNHAGEFVKIGDTTILDYMIENTDPELVTYELDVYWAVKGGVDPVAYINQYPTRIGLLHIKDESVIGESGTIDFEKIFQAAYANNIKEYYVEVERYTLPAENCVARSYDFLETSPFVK